MIIDLPRRTHIAALRQLWKEAFGDTDVFLDAFFSAAFSRSRCRCVFDGETPVSVLYWFDCGFRGQKIAYLYAVATKKSHRGQGLCRRLLEDTHRHLTESGYAGAILVPGEGSLFRFYEQSGYRTCVYSDECFFAAEDPPARLTPLSAEAYARLRREYLPESGVIQEGENLAFLETYARFYAGEDFLLAASAEGSNLYGIELLGNREAAPGILQALGCTEGTFHCPGGSKPFAMYRSFLGEEAPTWFGFAFN